ncbi:hypothetical protein Pmani_005715 [Petrolisthes manimaculis]|uniref:Uncharacterized protein n=1 Tax=Petrolisthes manimaculis TaxID=1843537 RepID=A0AAE1ULY0_9EUCA|nr:hypothetical protein Pmani_005715 [Petrolisthes manimaculis]
MSVLYGTCSSQFVSCHNETLPTLNPTEDAKPCVDEYFACSHIVPDKQTCVLYAGGEARTIVKTRERRARASLRYEAA